MRRQSRVVAERWGRPVLVERRWVVAERWGQPVLVERRWGEVLVERLGVEVPVPRLVPKVLLDWGLEVLIW